MPELGAFTDLTASFHWFGLWEELFIFERSDLSFKN